MNGFRIKVRVKEWKTYPGDWHATEISFDGSKQFRLLGIVPPIRKYYARVSPVFLDPRDEYQPGSIR